MSHQNELSQLLSVDFSVRQRFIDDPSLMPAQLASELALAELMIVSSLPETQRVFMPINGLSLLLESLPDWGNMTTILMVSGNVFEFKGAFPKGKYAHGYFNLYTKGDGLHGHIKLESIVAIALISRPFRGSESHSINFFGTQGELIFKVYLGRDKERVLLPHQVERFKNLTRTQNVEEIVSVESQ